MAIRNFSLTLVAFSFLLLTSCRTPPPKTTREVPVGSRPEVIVPSPTVPAPAPQPVPEELTRNEKKKVAVILGPGGAKTFAHVGVLKAFQQQRIPIEKVIGLEWGALMGGLYAVKGTTHDAEWKLYKMEQQRLFEPKGFFSRKSDELAIAELDPFLKESFGADDVGRSKVQFACPTRALPSGAVTWQNRGMFRDVLKRCLVFPPTFRVEGNSLAGPSQATEAVDWLVREGYNVIILVNPLGSAQPVAQDALRDHLPYVILWQEIKRALAETSRLNIDTVNVDTSAYPMNQFGAKKELIAIGESAGQKAALSLIEKYRF